MLEWIRRLFEPSIFEDEEKTRAVRILSSFGWVAFFVILFVALLRIVMGDFMTGIYLFYPIILVALFLMQLLLRRGFVKPSGYFLVVFVWGLLSLQAYTADGVRDAIILAYPIIILLAALLLSWKAGLVTGLLSLAVIWLLAVQEHVGARTLIFDAPLDYARDITAIFIISNFLTYILIHRLNRSLSDSRLELRERLRAEEKLQRQARYLSALHETTFGLLNRLELKPLLESILHRAGELLETPHVGIDLLLPDETGLRQELGTGEFIKWNNSIVQKGQGMVGKIWEDGNTLLVENYEEYAGKISAASHSGFVTVVGVPLKTGTKVIGTLVVAYQDREKKVTFEQVTVLERLAALASLAIDNARLYEGAQREIEERKHMEQSLRASEERFRKVFNNSNIAISIVSLYEGVFLEANEAFWKLSGLSSKTALGNSSLELGMWDDPASREQFVQRLLQNGSLQNVEVEFSKGESPRSAIGYYELIEIDGERGILCMFYDVSQQRKTQQELLESEERFRLVFHSSPIAICITDLENGRFIEANEAYWKLSGLSPQDALNKPATQLGIWSDSGVRQRFIENLKAVHTLSNPDYIFLNVATGESIHTLAVSELIDIKGSPCILSMFYDITAQKQAQEALRNAETRTSAILSSIPDMIFEVSKDGEFLDFMASADLTPTMPPDQFIGKNLKDLFPPLIAEQTVFALERALSTKHVHAFEYGMPPGEEIQFFEARVAPVTSESAIIMIRDISQRKWVETEREKLINELEEKNAESEALRDGMAIIVETLDESRTVSLILEQLEKVIPYDSASVQLLKNDMLEVVSTSKLENPDIHVGLRFAVNEQEPSYPLFMGQASYIMIDDIRVLSLSYLSPLHTDIRSWLAVPLKVKGNIIGIIALDGHRVNQFSQKDVELILTYANQVAIALENARLFSEVQNELVERQRLIEELEVKNAELERFTYTVSHDLKSPVITIRGFLGFLEQDALSGNMKRLKGDIKRISDATEKMQTLLNELLDLSRVGRLVNPPSIVPFNEIVSDALELVHGRIQAGHIKVQVQDGLPSVYVDRSRIVEVMQNLVDNAAKFTGENTVIEIGQQGTEGSFPIFYVRDQGIGIPAVHHERIFGLFNKLDADSEGTGIGLALVKRIIEIHKGRIWVQSEPKKGATFFFTLPTGPET